MERAIHAGVLQEALMRHRLENDPANAPAHFNLGVLLLGRKDTASAIGHLRDALRLEPEQPMALNDLGAALESQGKLEDALEQFRHALRIEPDYTSARFNLANGLAAQGKLDEAAANFRQVISAEAGDTAARRAAHRDPAPVGQRRRRRGASEQRRRQLPGINRTAAGRCGSAKQLTASFWRGPATWQRAAAQFEAALKANPSHQAARRNLEAVRSKLSKHKQLTVAVGSTP